MLEAGDRSEELGDLSGGSKMTGSFISFLGETTLPFTTQSLPRVTR